MSAMLATVQEWNERADVCCILLKGNGPKAGVLPLPSPADSIQRTADGQRAAMAP